MASVRDNAAGIFLALLLYQGVVRSTAQQIGYGGQVILVVTAVFAIVAIVLNQWTFKLHPIGWIAGFALCAFLTTYLLSFFWGIRSEYAEHIALKTLFVVPISYLLGSASVRSDSATLIAWLYGLGVLFALLLLLLIWSSKGTIFVRIVDVSELGEIYQNINRFFAVLMLVSAYELKYSKSKLLPCVVFSYSLFSVLHFGGVAGIAALPLLLLVVFSGRGRGESLVNVRFMLRVLVFAAIGILIVATWIWLAPDQEQPYAISRALDKWAGLDGGESGRLYLYREALTLWLTSPMTGVGIGVFSSALGYEMEGRYVHNIFLQVLVDAGLLPMTFFLVFLGATFAALLKMHNSSTNGLFISLFLFSFLLSNIGGDVEANRALFYFAGFVVASSRVSWSRSG